MTFRALLTVVADGHVPCFADVAWPSRPTLATTSYRCIFAIIPEGLTAQEDPFEGYGEGDTEGIPATIEVERRSISVDDRDDIELE